MITVNQYRVLSSIDSGNNYGYTIANDTGVFLGSVYNTLAALVGKGFLKTRKFGRRSIYLLTEEGREALKEFRNLK